MMKITIDLHDARVERPEKSCEMLVLCMNNNHKIYCVHKTPYSKVHDQFCNHDTWEKAERAFVEDDDDGSYILWAELENVQKALSESQCSECTCLYEKYERFDADKAVADRVEEWIESHSGEEYCPFCKYRNDCNGHGVSNYGNGPTYSPCAERDIGELLDEDALMQYLQKEGE